MLDAVTGVTVSKKVVDAAVLHLRHVSNEPQLAGKLEIVVVKVQSLFWYFENTRVVGVDSRQRANNPVARDGEREFVLESDGGAHLRNALVPQDAKI